MYISRWHLRAFGLVVGAGLVMFVLGPIVYDGNNLMSTTVVMLGILFLVLLAWGQLQYAYSFSELNELLRKVANGRPRFGFDIDQNLGASVVLADGHYRVEVLDRESLELTIYVVSRSRIEVRRLTGKLLDIVGNEPSDLKLVYEEEPFVPTDSRKDMERLSVGLRSTLPDKGRF